MTDQDKLEAVVKLVEKAIELCKNGETVRRKGFSGGEVLLTALFVNEKDDPKLWEATDDKIPFDTPTVSDLINGRRLEVGAVKYPITVRGQDKTVSKNDNNSNNNSAQKVKILPLPEPCTNINIKPALARILATFRAQQILYDTYPLLKKESMIPLATLSRVDSTEYNWASFYYYPPLFDTLSKEFSEFVVRCRATGNSEQDAKLVAVYQLTRAGKTKLCYTLGFTKNVVMLRYAALKDNLPFALYLENSEQYFSESHNPRELGTLTLRNQNMVKIWLCCYIRLYQLLLEDADFLGLDTLKRRECFMRLTSNGLAHNYIEQLFRLYSSQLTDSMLLPDSVQDLLSFAAEQEFVFVIDDFLGSAEKRYKHMFPHQPEMNNSPTKIGGKQLKQFSQKHGEPKHSKKGEERSTSLFYAIVTVAEDFAKKGISVIFTSTRFRAMQWMLDEECLSAASRSRLKMVPFSMTPKHMPLMELIRMKEFLYTHFDLPKRGRRYSELDLEHALREFVGRMGFFFDCFLAKTMAVVKRAESGEELFDLLVDLLKGEALTTLDADIKGYITKLVDRVNNDQVKGDLVKRLYFFQVMHNGCAVFDQDDLDVINAGVAYLVQSDTDNRKLVRMFFEPRVKQLFVEHANELLPNAGLDRKLSDIHPDNDPIFREISNYYKTNIGGGTEEFVARIFMRMGDQSLYEALDAKKCGVRPDSVAAFVKFAPISICGTAVELHISEVEHLLHPKDGMLMRSDNRRVDLATALHWCSGAPVEFSQLRLPAAAAQVKNWAKHQVPSIFYNKENTGSLQSLDPKNFYGNSEDCAKFTTTYNTEPVFKVYVRIVVSMLGFNSTVERAVYDYNQSKLGVLQPIILFQPTAEHLGKFHRSLVGELIQTGSHASMPAWGSDYSLFAIAPQGNLPLVAAQKTIDSFFLPFRPSHEQPTKKQKTNNGWCTEEQCTHDVY